MSVTDRPYPRFVVHLCLSALFLAFPLALTAQTVPPALESPAAQPPRTGPHGEKIPGMPKFHDPAPYDIDEHTGYKQIFDGKSFTGWDADPTIWRVEDGVMVGETFEGKAKGNNYIVYRGDKTRDFDLKRPHPMFLSFFGSILGGYLGRIRGRLSRPLKAHGPGRRPGNGVALDVGNGDHGVIEARTYVRNARGDVLTLASANARGFLAHFEPFRIETGRAGPPKTLFDALFLLAGDRLGRPLAGPCIGMGALPANR